MYYNGKKEFYLKQYVIPIFTLAFSICLVGSGVYIYWNTSTSSTSKDNMVIASNELKDVEQVQKSEVNLLNKNAKVSFEEDRVKQNRVYAYVYINNDVLYNEKIIENGLATINKETKNLTYQNDLIQAQAYAKQLARGVWKR